VQAIDEARQNARYFERRFALIGILHLRSLKESFIVVWVLFSPICKSDMGEALDTVLQHLAVVPAMQRTKSVRTQIRWIRGCPRGM
jgi:hypothetical protein